MFAELRSINSNVDSRSLWSYSLRLTPGSATVRMSCEVEVQENKQLQLPLPPEVLYSLQRILQNSLLNSPSLPIASQASSSIFLA